MCMLFCLSCVNSLFSQESVWEIDQNHSAIRFEISYFGIGTVQGTFDNFDGNLRLNGNSLNAAQLSIEIQVASINTNQKTRDEHLRSKDFFNVAENPSISFNSTSIEHISDNTYQVAGIFLMGGISKNLKLTITDKGEFFHPRFQKTVKVVEVEGIVLREQHGIGTNYGPAAKALGNEVAFSAQIQLTEKTNSDQ